MPTIRLAVLCLALATTGTARADEGRGAWEKVSDKDGIVVQRRSVDGYKLKEFLGRGIIAAPITRVLAVIRDANRRAEWMPSCADSHLLEENLAARTQIAYHRTKAPWPVSDRDSTNRAEMIVELANNRVYFPFEAVTLPATPPVKGVVRMPFMRGHWLLTPVDGGKATEAEYQVFANPGGILPDWLANLASKTLPRETIAGLRKQVTRASYPEFEAEVARSPETQQLLAHSK